VTRCADHFLTSDVQELRLETVRTCSRLLKLALAEEGKDNKDEAYKTTVAETVTDVLKKLLMVGITDSGEILLSSDFFLAGIVCTRNSYTLLFNPH